MSVPFDAVALGPLGAGQGAMRHFTITWPSGVTSTGRFEFTVTTDEAGQLFEANAAGTGETNNATQLTIASTPDLQIANLVVTTSNVTAGSPVTVTWNDINTGIAATASGWFDRIEVRNQTTGELLLDTAVFYDPALPGNGALGAGQSKARTFTFNMPDGSRGVGNIQIAVTADRNTSGAGTIVEITDPGNAEGNNQATTTFQSVAKTYPDLAVSNFTAPATGVGGATISVGWAVSNSGPVATGAANWVDRIILSTDQVFGNADDVVIAEVAHAGALAPGGSYSVQHTATVPIGKEGTFYLTVRTDAAGAVIEPDTRANNDAAAKQIVLSSPFSDLTVEVVVGPTAALSGDEISISWRVANLGPNPTDTGAWSDRIVLSSNLVVDASDIVLADVAHTGVLAAGQSYTGQKLVRLPDGIAGTFRILVAANANSGAFEKGLTGNNTGVSVGQIAVAPGNAPDLTVSAVSAPAAGVPNEVQTVTWTVTNNGGAAARAPWIDRIYISADGTLSGATLLASVTRNFDLAAGANYVGTAQVTLPDFADGTYRFLVIADSNSQIYEAGLESNNSATNQIGFTHPDLKPSAVVVTGALTSGDPINVSWTVTNDGTGTALGSWTDTIYLSRDLVVGTDDIKLGDFIHDGALSPTLTYSRQENVTLPLGATGDYHVLVVSDRANAVHEISGESNNVASAPLSVALSPFADLAVSNVVIPERTIANPAPLTVTWTVTNNGTGPGRTDAWIDRIVRVAGRDHRQWRRPDSCRCRWHQRFHP